MSKKLDKLLFKKMRNANLKYNLIETGDCVAVGISGGKDSLTLLYFLTLLKKYTPLQFDLIPIHLDLGWENDTTPIKQFCESLGLSLYIEHTNIRQIVFDVREEHNPCSLCSNLRRGALNRTAKKLGCNKVALGHHMDDVVHTLLLSVLFEGRYHLFKPKTYLDRIDITVIRPMLYFEEKEVEDFIESKNIVTVTNRCVADGWTRREDMKKLTDDLCKRYPDAKQKILSSIENVDQGSFWTN
ncbi:MAG: ATP-binding protein [Bacillota bacterium]|nr:ATP-binding protein [Bacillota bacterium]